MFVHLIYLCFINDAESDQLFSFRKKFCHLGLSAHNYALEKWMGKKTHVSEIESRSRIVKFYGFSLLHVDLQVEVIQVDL